MSTNQTEAPPPPHPEGRPPHPEPTDLGSLRRSLTDRHVAGVAGGLARHFAIDPIIIRVALVVLVFFGGAGVLLYVGAWLFVPEEGTEHAVIRLDARSRSFLLYVVAGIAALALLGDTIGHFRLPWGLLIAGIAVVVILGNVDRVRLRSRRDRTEYEYVAPTEAPTTTSYAPDYTPYTAQVAAEVEQKVQQKVQRYQARRRGPILFWFTLAVILVTQGALGIIDLAGADVARSAYPALALGVIGLMLVIGSYWGRAGGLILLGLISAVILIGATAADQWDLDGHSRSISYDPTSSSAVQSSYDLGTGELTLDLSGVSDPAALAGREIDVHGHVGTIDVIVPSALNVDTHGLVHGPGAVELFGEEHGGIHTSFSYSSTEAADAGAAPLTIDADLNVGKITVETR
jgi:phage shock protein PspC (stress-responsive transcriptional regulator)